MNLLRYGLSLLLYGLIAFPQLIAQDTFSIVAVDSVTGEVGSAGATCLDLSNSTSGALVISDIIPGRGGIHTQAYWNGVNQSNARNRMELGDTPAEIISWVLANDAGGFGLDSSYRQYGIVDFDSTGSPRAAGYSGVNTDDYKDHLIGPNYAIQGNILLGPQILDSMESRFLNTQGSLADKLMAAMQGANVPGADTRCLNEGVSSLSAFIRVSRPYDLPGQYYLDLSVLQTPFGAEPIDSLQSLYSNWIPPICDFAIPANAVIVSGALTTTGNNGFYWVCAGDTLTITSSTNAVYLEPGAVAISQPGGAITTAYVQEGAVFNGQGTTFNTVYIEPGSVIADAGLAVTSISCDSIRFDYSLAPTGGCNELTRLEEKDFDATNWKVITDQEAGLLNIAYLGPRVWRAELRLLDLAGRELLSQTEKISAGNTVEVNIATLPPGLYVLVIAGDRERFTSRILIR